MSTQQKDKTTDNTASSASSSEGNTKKPTGPYSEPTACHDLKEAHDKCFDEWFVTQYLHKKKDLGCVKEWNEYKACIEVRLFSHFCGQNHNTLACVEKIGGPRAESLTKERRATKMNGI